MKKVVSTILVLFFLFAEKTFSQTPIERFLGAPAMRGASVSFMIKDITNGKVVHSYDAERELIPASVMKIVTTATALELLGSQFQYETVIMYDGQLKDGVLDGNLYICGSGDPTPGSSELGGDHDKILLEWIRNIKNAGISSITGSVISDESIFDTEGVSMKWLREDLGNYYGQGSYGLNIFDNAYTLFLQSNQPNSKPEIISSVPDVSFISFQNYLTADKSEKDSACITGFPFSNERYLYGTIPSNRSAYPLKGDIPEPSLFLAQYFTKLLEKDTVKVMGAPSCYRILSQKTEWKPQERKRLTSTSSLPVKELVRITNHVSHNLYADALLKTIGFKYKTDEKLSSFDKGFRLLKNYWEEKGVSTSSLWMYDGSGLSPSNKLTASFLCELLAYMFTQSSASKSFIASLPRAGMEGTVSNMLKGSSLQGVARLKSGSMSRVRSYAGYVTKGNVTYTVAIIVNNFSCTQARMKTDIEQLLLSLLP